MKATDAATQPDGTVDEEKAVVLAIDMAKMDGLTQDRLVKEAQENPTATVDALIEKVRKPPKIRVVRIELVPDQSLKKYASDEKLSEEEALQNLIVEALASKGYYPEAKIRKHAKSRKRGRLR